MFRPLWGGTANTASALPPSRDRGGTRLAWPSRPRSPPAAKRLLGRQPGRRHLRGQGDQGDLPDRAATSARPRCCGSASATPATRPCPPLAVTISIAGKEGETSSLPFGIHDPQPELAQPDRPVWVLAEDYPEARRLRRNRAAPRPPARKTFDFGPLKPGATVEGGLEAERGQGRHATPCSTASTPASAARRRRRPPAASTPGGSFVGEDHRARRPNTEVTDSGEIVEIGKRRKKSAGE